MLPNGDNFVEEHSSRSWTVVGEDSNGWRPPADGSPTHHGPQQDHFISGREAKVVAVLEVEVVVVLEVEVEEILLLYRGSLQDHFISRGEVNVVVVDVAVFEVEVVLILGPLQDHFISRGGAFVSPRPGFQSV